MQTSDFKWLILNGSKINNIKFQIHQKSQINNHKFAIIVSWSLGICLLSLLFACWSLSLGYLDFNMNDKSRIFSSHIIMVNEVGSTNTELLRHAGDYEQGTVLCARRQTAGRGRRRRNWRSHKGGLYFSLLLKDQKDIVSIYPLILLSALAVVRSIQSCATQGLAIKWPNDIYINHRKVCGILAESSTQNNKTHLVIGIGINVNNKVSHMKDLRHPAVSLSECKGEDLNLNELLLRIVNELDLLYADFLSNNFSMHLPELNRLLYSRGQEIELTSGETVRSITPLAFTHEGKLLCLENGKETIVFMGEI